MIEIHFFANQMLALKDKDACALHLHVISRGSDAGPHTSVGAAELAFDDHCLVGGIGCEFFEPKIGERPKE